MENMNERTDDETRADTEEVFRAWNKLEEVLNLLEDLGEDPHVTSHVGGAEVHGHGGRVRWSHVAERWVRDKRS